MPNHSIKRLRDISPTSQKHKNQQAKMVNIIFQDDEATKRLVIHSAKRIIATHKEELEKLAKLGGIKPT